MKLARWVGVAAALVLAVSAAQLYAGVRTGLLVCADRHASELCEWNYLRTGFAEAGVGLGLVLFGVAWWLRRRR